MEPDKEIDESRLSYYILGGGADALSAYTFRGANTEAGPVFFWSLLACILLNSVSGVVFALR